MAQGEAVGEVFVVDNNSSDNTAEVVAAWLKEQGNPLNWHMLHQPVPGACAARNLPLARVACDWIQFLDSDDELLPGKLTGQLSELGADVHVVVGRSEHRDELGNTWISEPNRYVRLGLIQGNLGDTCSNLFRTDLIRQVGGWDEALSSSQEYDLMFRLWGAGARFHFHDAVLTRIHERAAGRISTTNLTRKWLNHVDLQRRMLEMFDLEEATQQEREPFLQAYFDRLRTLAHWDLEAAVERFEGLPEFERFRPRKGGPNTRFYIWAYLLLGFKGAERFKRLIKH